MMNDEIVKEIAISLDEIEDLLLPINSALEKAKEEIADLKEKHERLMDEFAVITDEVFSQGDLRAAVREIQDEMRKVNRKLILIHEV
tara:strand:- start:779 stop:1039 length:261 start_codon:yes stop_codon:yes gene_type:complete